MVVTLRTLVVIFAVLPMFLSLAAKAGDRSPSPFAQVPSRTPVPLVPEVQTDGFSCGASGLGEMLFTTLRSLPLVISIPLLALIAFLGWKLLKAALLVRKRLWAELFGKRLHGS